MEEPRHALEAPSHYEPYAWYARLRAHQPIFFDGLIDLWVVSGTYLVEQALLHPHLRVRPPAEPVPRALQGRPVGEVFAQLVRMNDGDFHARHRPEVAGHAGSFAALDVAEAAEAATRDLLARSEPNALLSAIPVQAMARLLGVADADLDRTVSWVHEFTQGIGAGAGPERIARADLAAQALLQQGEREGLPHARAANRIALMQQALDATAGLLGNSVRAALVQDTQSRDPAGLVARIARHDPAVHNTRRYAATGLELGGEDIEAGQGLVLVLVPDHPFGAGAHACPGDRIALQIATTALATLQSLAPLESIFGTLRGYRPLPNARIPVFTGP